MSVVIISTDYVLRYCNQFVMICTCGCVGVCLVVCVCTPDRNDLKHGTVVVLDTVCRSLLIFWFKRLRVMTSISAHIKYLLLLKLKTGVFMQPR